MRRTLTFLFGLAICLSRADSFGRFGYKPLADLPGFSVSASGVNLVGGLALAFAHPSQIFKSMETSATAQTVSLDGGAGMPSAVRFSLVGNSLDLRFDEGASLTLSGTDAPFLSWKDGSSGPDVPTPKVKWLLMSYPTAQVPVVLGFSGEPYSFKVTGTPGKWKLDCPEFGGWLRLMLPLGDRTVATPDTASLGTLADQIAKEDSHWTVQTPRVLRSTIQSDDLGVDAEWTFDGPGAVIPPTVTLAELGGYPISVLSEHHELPGSAGLGPIIFVDGVSLKVHFPCRRVRPGRALGLGAATELPIASASPLDIPSVVDLALESLLAHRDAALAKLADDTSSQYLENAAYAVEPLTGQQMPFQSDGSGADLAAAHALLMQATLDAVNSNDANSLLDSLAFVRDWWTWKILGTNPAVSRRATALAALAGALSQSDGGRLLGATLEAGLEGDEGWRIWKHRFGVQPDDSKPIQPLRDLREAFFALRSAAQLDPFFALLQSPIRIGIGSGIELGQSNSQLELSWKAEDVKPSVITFFDSELPQFRAGVNLLRITVEPAKGYVSMYYVPVAPGPCQASISLPASSPPIPPQANPPAYKE